MSRRRWLGLVLVLVLFACSAYCITFAWEVLWYAEGPFSLAYYDPRGSFLLARDSVVIGSGFRNAPHVPVCCRGRAGEPAASAPAGERVEKTETTEEPEAQAQ